MIDNLTIWINGVVILLSALAVFRKEIVTLFKKEKLSIDIKSSVFEERLFEGKLALNKCYSMMNDDFDCDDPKQIKMFDGIAYYAFSKTTDLIREILVENDFLNKYPTVEEYKNFIDNRKISIINCVSANIDLKYDDDCFDTPRKIHKANNMKHIQKYFDVIEDFFWTCRRIEERFIENNKE